MIAVKLNHSNTKIESLSQRHLNDDDKRCGEVFITLSRTLIFHCSICSNNFGSYGYFLDHLSTQHYEDVQGEVIEIEKSDIESPFEDDSFNKHIEEQDSVIYEKDDNDYECEKILHKVEVYTKPKFEQIEEVFLEEPYSLVRNSPEQTADEFGEINVGKIIDEIEEQTFDTQLADEEISHTKKNRPSSRKELKSFSCDECGKAFKTNQKLRRHHVIHSDERNHQCNICGFAFKERTNLDLHVRRHTGLKTISCGYCSKSFFTTTEALIHRRTHTGERPYVCPTCGMAFSNGGGLKVHAKRHYSKRHFKCNYCGKCFYEKSDVKRHMLVHTKEKNFVCEICAATFPRHNSWMRHAKLHEMMKI